MSQGSRRTPRRLTQGEIELWTVVTADVRPMRVRSVAPPPTEQPPPSPPPASSRLVTSPSPTKFVPSPPPPPPARVGDLDHRTRAKIKRGRLEVDVKLDLHGMRQDEAQRALNGFLRRAQATGAKVAIVVTGKGLSREEGGVLRRVVPMWLQAPSLRDVVVSFGEAARHHGGEGALYVRIRRADRAHG